MAHYSTAQASDACVFHIGDLLSVTTGELSAPKGKTAVDALVAFVTGQEPSSMNTACFSKDVKQCLEEQLPFLKNVHPSDIRRLFGASDVVAEEFMKIWVDTQAVRFGRHHYIVPLQKWQRQKMSAKLPPLPFNDNAEKDKKCL